MSMESDTDLASLLRAAGVRVQPTEQMTADVRAAVEAEWRATCAARRRRQRYMAFSAAAGIAVAGLGLWLARPLYVAPEGPVASLARLEGAVEVRHGSDEPWGPMPEQITLQAGDDVRTSDTGRVALKFLNGVEVRIDSGTRISLLDKDRMSMRRGGVYVDSGVNGADASRALELDTPAGPISHLGTQYEARVVGDAVRVSVREGSVAVDLRGDDAVGKAGEQLVIEDGHVSRKAVAVNADSWGWIDSVTPPFAIEGRSLESFLAWAGRETGRRIEYASPDVAHNAHTIVLKGSVSGLSPDAAVNAVLSTTSLQPTIESDRIRVTAAKP